MKIEEEKKGEVRVFNISGKFDAKSSPPLEKALSDAVGNGDKCIAINFKEIDYISSAGLKVLLSITRKLNEEGGKMKLSNFTSQVKEVFDLTGFTQIFEIFPDIEECLGSFK